MHSSIEKSCQLVIPHLLLVIIVTDAILECDNLLQQCNQLTVVQCTQCTQCSRDLTNFLMSKAPSGVYQISTSCNCQLPFTADLAYCDMKTSDGGWLVIQYQTRDGVSMN